MLKRFPYVMASLAALALMSAPSHAFAEASEGKPHQAEHAAVCDCGRSAECAATKELASKTTSPEELQRIWSSP
jgi:hypothetical protein